MGCTKALLPWNVILKVGGIGGQVWLSKVWWLCQARSHLMITSAKRWVAKLQLLRAWLMSFEVSWWDCSRFGLG